MTYPLGRMIKLMETKIQDVTAELARFKKYVHLLEEENARLKSEIARYVEANGHEGLDKGQESSFSGLDSLVNLYDRGFHICNLYFGGLRQEDCLFCSALMQKTGENTDE